tara:strand:+ start:2710 stop:3225 length:516 start_codon:yes stop_codon:yes gene_type:complete
MAGVRLTYDTSDLRSASRRFERLEDGARDPLPLMQDIAAALESSTLRRFEEERGPDGVGWQKSVRARNEGGKTLTDQGHLADSINSSADRRRAVVGTNLIYAGVHQDGAEIHARAGGRLVFAIGNQLIFAKKVTIPARPFLGVDAGDEQEIGDIVGDFIAGRLGSGLGGAA